MLVLRGTKVKQAGTPHQNPSSLLKVKPQPSPPGSSGAGSPLVEALEQVLLWFPADLNRPDNITGQDIPPPGAPAATGSSPVPPGTPTVIFTNFNPNMGSVVGVRCFHLQRLLQPHQSFSKAPRDD